MSDNEEKITHAGPGPIRYGVALVLGLALSFALSWVLSPPLASLFFPEFTTPDQFLKDYSDYIMFYVIPFTYGVMLVSMGVVYEIFRSLSIAKALPFVIIVAAGLTIMDTLQRLREFQEGELPVSDMLYVMEGAGFLGFAIGFSLYFLVRGRFRSVE